MSVATEITRIKEAISAAYAVCEEKGATMPSVENVGNLADTIDTISGGGGFDAYIVVRNLLPGTTVTATSGTYIYTGVADEDNKAVINIKHVGTYTLSAPHRYFSGTLAVTTATAYLLRANGVPSQYQEVECLESTGTQYIQLNEIFKKTDEVQVEAKITESTSISEVYVMSPKTWNSNNNRFAMLGFYKDYVIDPTGNLNCFNFAYGNGNTGGTAYTNSTRDNHKHTFRYRNQVFSMDDIDKDASFIGWGGDTDELRLFWGYSSDGGAPKAVKAAFYTMWHMRGGDYIQALTPCYRKSDGVAGMWDAVTETFFTNSGSGTFIVGEKICR